MGTSRERVMNSFAHREPDRPPLWLGMSPEFEAKAMLELRLDAEGVRRRLGDDFRVVRARQPPPARPLSPGATCRTVFGVEHSGIGYGQPTSHPLSGAASLGAVEAYPWPDPAGPDVSQIRAEAASYKGEFAILGGDWAPLWHDAIDLFGMEGLFLAMYDTPEVVEAALARITDYYVETNRRIFDAAGREIDILFIGNDLGSQTGPLLGEGLFRQFLLPCLARLFSLGHDYGVKVQLHCCGGIAPLLPALIEAGLDAVHAVQTTCRGMDLVELKRTYGHKLVFNGGIDSHHVLIDGTPDTVRAATRAVLDVMAPGGGYVAGASHDSILEETPVENIVAMCDAVLNYGA
jgi:uroporphyrinogen decarboxylase